eukprot:UN00966
MKFDLFLPLPNQLSGEPSSAHRCAASQQLNQSNSRVALRSLMVVLAEGGVNNSINPINQKFNF